MYPFFVPLVKHTSKIENVLISTLI